MDMSTAILLNSNGGSAIGSIAETDLFDTYKVELLAGATYTFSVTGESLQDSYLRLFDANGTFISADDDSGDGLNSLLTFEATTGGTYYLEVSGYANSYYGNYGIFSNASLPANIAPALTGTTANFGTVTVGQAITLTESSLLAGWTDANGDALHVQNLNASSGTLTNNNNGTWSLRPTATGPITLTYEVSDGSTAVTAQNSVAAQSAPAAAISITTLDSTTSEAGDTARIQVALNVAPTGSFTVTLTSFDTTEGGFQTANDIVATKTLTFDASNWNTPQIVTLTGVQDYLNDGDVAYTVRVTAANNASTPAANYATAIRDLSNTITLINEGDRTAGGTDRDVPVYLIGDDGRPQQDLLYGNDGNDRLYGGYMVDELHGGIGNDRLYGGYEDDFLYGEAGDDQIYGEQDDDYLNGGAGNDRLDGGIGADTLVGGDGNDVYYVTLADDGSVEDTIIEDATTAGGVDTVYIPFQVESYIAPTAVEVVRMNAGFGDTSVTGNTSDNGLYGNAGDNMLDGGSGNDTLDGGSGSDSLLGGLGNDSLLGGNGNDTLTSSSGNDVVNAGSGDDLIVGGDGAGNDSYIGGSGTDTVQYTSTTAGIVVNLTTGTASGTQIGTDTLSQVENITGGSGNDTLTGNSADNVIDGYAGNDIIDGAGGADVMRGGLGADAYTVDNAADVVVELAGQGIDGVRSSLAAYTLTANVENGRILSTGTASLTGNELANILSGGNGNNTLDGDIGNDTLIGGLGKDMLTGGAGNDTFDFNALPESGITSTTWDVISDFVRGQDKVDLSTIDANAATTANDAFTSFIGATASFTTAGQLKLVGDVLYANTDTDTTAEFAVQLVGVSALAMSDLVA